LSDQTDLQSALDAKQDDMVILSYGNSTWNDFITAYQKNWVVYCRASSNSNPATGAQWRLAFMAYVNNASNPTEVEFQYYRSRSDHSSAANQLDEVYIYKLTSNWTWTVTQRNTAAKATAWTWINLTYGSGNMTISAAAQYDNTAYGTSWDWVTNKAPTKNAVYDKISAMDATIAWKQDTLTAWTWINIGSADWRQWPAPDWFHIPSIDEWEWVKTITNWLSPAITWDWWRTYLHIPFAGYRNYSSTSLYSQGSVGYYWSSSPAPTGYNNAAHLLRLDSSSVDLFYSYYRAYGYSVRCFKDEYVAPDSSWIVVRWTLGSAWIFWNQTDWIISITWDWTTGYTIMDKNLWATTVYNDWDTLTQANMGNMYQWWNNYWFPSTWTITNTSSTQVDASGYWPTNPYSSDTFITWNADWSSVQNDDLWGDTTWIIENVISNTWVTSVNGQTWDVTISWATWWNITWNIADQTDLQEAISSATAGAVSDTAYWDSWDWITGIAPSKNAIYDKISAMDVTISWKANSSDVNTKTFTLSSTSDTTNATSAVNWYENWNTPIIKMMLRTEPTYFYLSYDMVTSEAWWDRHILYFKSPVRNWKYEQIVITTDTSWSVTRITESEEDALSTQIAYTNKGTSTKVPTITTNTLGQVTSITETNIAFPVTSVNWQTWAVAVNDVKSSSTAPSSPTEWMVWYDTTNDQLKVYDWTNWNVTGKEYNAWKWIEIKNWPDYSAMQWPAPDGFHVPLNTEWQAVYDVWAALGGWSSDWTNFWIALKLPFAGRRSYSSADVGSQGTVGSYWSSSRYYENSAYYLGLRSTALNPQNSNYRANGFSVRCFKNSPVVPMSSWTKLYWTSIESWWIFWDSTDWLISLSSNGTTWITISDKNLWATTVWNSWDTLSEANCWKYYQRWNNYWFPRTWTIANQSTTQVDASNYWPWNYYSSSTFITYNWPWDITGNGNLRWWETWVISNAITNTGVLSVNGQTGNVTITAWDMNYSDFNWASKTWATITLDLASTISPSSDFTVNAPSTIKDGQTYILRVNNEGTAYEMTLWTNVTNPYDTDITLTDDWVDQFVFLAINWELELQPEWWGGWGWDYQLAPNSPLKPKYRWYGTQAQYDALTQYYTDEEWDTVYFTI